MNWKLFKNIVLPGSLLLLTGCSPHPATGDWSAQAESAQQFARLSVQYEGRADLYSTGAKEAERHCFWGGVSGTSISLTCVPAMDTDAREHYRFTVTESGEGVLSRDGEIVTRFLRGPQ